MNNISLLAKKYQNYISLLIGIDSKIFQHINDVTLFHNSKSKTFLDNFYRKGSSNSNNYISFLLNPVDKIINNTIKTVDQFRTDNINNNIINYYSQIFSPYDHFVIKPNIILTESNIDYLIENNINYIFYNNSIVNISKEYILENLSYFSRYCIDFIYNDLCTEIDELEPFCNNYIYSNFIKSIINNMTSTSSYYYHIDIISKYESINTLIKHKKTKDTIISELTIWLDELLTYGRITFHHLNDNTSHHYTLMYLFDKNYISIEDLYTKYGFKIILNTNLIQNKSFDYENPLDKILFSTPNINIESIIHSDLYNIKYSYVLSNLYFRFNNVQTNIFNIESIQPKYFNILIKSLLTHDNNWLTGFNFKYSILNNYKILTLDILNSLDITTDKILFNIDSFLEIKNLDDIFLFINKTYNKKELSMSFTNNNLEELKSFLNSFIPIASKHEYNISFKNISILIPILTEDNLEYALKTSFFQNNTIPLELFYDDNYQFYHNILLKEEYLNLIVNKLKISESLPLGNENFIKYYDLNRDVFFNMILDKYIFENRIELSTSLVFLFKYDKNNFYKLINLYCNRNNINLIDYYFEIIFSESYEEYKYEVLEYIYLEYFNSTSNAHELIYNVIIYFHNNSESKENFKKIQILNNLLNFLVDNLIIKKIDLELLIVKYYENYSNNFLDIHRQFKFTNFL